MVQWFYTLNGYSICFSCGCAKFVVYSVKLIWLQQLFMSVTPSVKALKIPKMAVFFARGFLPAVLIILSC